MTCHQLSAEPRTEVWPITFRLRTGFSLPFRIAFQHVKQNFIKALGSPNKRAAILECISVFEVCQGDISKIKFLMYGLQKIYVWKSFLALKYRTRNIFRPGTDNEDYQESLSAMLTSPWQFLSWAKSYLSESSGFSSQNKWWYFVYYELFFAFIYLD